MFLAICLLSNSKAPRIYLSSDVSLTSTKTQLKTFFFLIWSHAKWLFRCATRKLCSIRSEVLCSRLVNREQAKKNLEGGRQKYTLKLKELCIQNILKYFKEIHLREYGIKRIRSITNSQFESAKVSALAHDMRINTSRQFKQKPKTWLQLCCDDSLVFTI